MMATGRKGKDSEVLKVAWSCKAPRSQNQDQEAPGSPRKPELSPGRSPPQETHGPDAPAGLKLAQEAPQERSCQPQKLQEARVQSRTAQNDH